jgi:hypothetical protein
MNGQTALKTADESRAELRFPDLTTTRVGSNTFFRFFAGGRDMTLDGGTMLFSSPKGAGGGKVQAGPSAQSAATVPSAVQRESPGLTSSSSGPPPIEVISPEN